MTQPISSRGLWKAEGSVDPSFCRNVSGACAFSDENGPEQK